MTGSMNFIQNLPSGSIILIIFVEAGITTCWGAGFLFNSGAKSFSTGVYPDNSRPLTIIRDADETRGF
jgi:hypothetical protein